MGVRARGGLGGVVAPPPRTLTLQIHWPPMVAAGSTSRFGAWSGVTINVGVKGLAAQKAFISAAYPEGIHLVHMDDDVESLEVAKNEGGQVELKKAPSTLLRRVVSLAVKFRNSHDWLSH